ncbi:MAG: hypothetical protein FJZ78_10385 [Bacteroidetes bacterium]|nr:hypothetical protein [Bacteroidota bacterium]
MKKNKILALAMVAFFSAAVIVSCGKKAETEEATEQTEAPADTAAAEHPSEHPAEHPADSTK